MMGARLAAAACALLVGCSRPALPAPKPPGAPARPAPQAPAIVEGHSRPATAEERFVLQQLMREVERLRQLRFDQPVKVYVKDRAAMRAYVAQAMDEDELEVSRRRYLALGLVDPALDVRELIEQLMETELIGYYDPQSSSLAIRDDLARSLRSKGQTLQWRATVVHELVHALQDQRLGLASLMLEERSTDGGNAFAALVEGDATLTMVAYVVEQEGVTLDRLLQDLPRLSRQLLGSPGMVSAELRAAPAIVREPLLFRYREGALFAAYLVARSGYEALNLAYAAPPPSTLAVADPHWYLEAESMPGLALLDLDWTQRHGYARLDEDTLGALEVAAILQETGVPYAKTLHAWRGDRYAVLQRAGDEPASAWCLRFASEAHAARAARGFQRLGDAARRVQRLGSDLLITHNLAAELHAPLQQAFRRWATSRATPRNRRTRGER